MPSRLGFLSLVLCRNSRLKADLQETVFLFKFLLTGVRVSVGIHTVSAVPLLARGGYAIPLQ